MSFLTDGFLLRTTFFCTFRRDHSPCADGQRFCCEAEGCQNAVCEDHGKFVEKDGRIRLHCPVCAVGERVAE